MSASTPKGGGGVDEASDDQIALVIRLLAIRRVGKDFTAAIDARVSREVG